MTKPISELYVEIFDWPDRLLVECDGMDVDYPRFYPDLPDYTPEPPYLVDLSELEDGWCGCSDFRINVQPFLNSSNSGTTPHRTVCKHIIAARDYLRRINYTKPKKLPTEIILL